MPTVKYDEMEKYVEFLPVFNDSNNKIEMSPKTFVKEAAKTLSFREAICQFKDIIQKFRQNFKIRLKSNDTAKVPVIKITFDPYIQPVRQIEKKYSTKQRTVVKSYVEQIVKFDFSVPHGHHRSKWVLILS